MWNFLQRIIGHSSTSQERMMQGKDIPAVISELQLEQAKNIIEPLILPAFELTSISIAERKGMNTVYNNKGKPVSYYKTILHPDYYLHLYLNIPQFLNHNSNAQLILEPIEIEVSKLPQILSLPSWESLIHIDVKKHKNLVKILPDHPWTLYKVAKSTLTKKSTMNQVSGYPQWSINDIDHRVIKDSQFLFQIEIPEKESFIYFFKDASNNEPQIFIQKT